jgi:scyllo-inositol 2-dehydrogenase (NADP+)
VAALRAALIGYGLAGRVIHRPLIEAVEDLHLTHVVTADPQRREQAAQDLPGARLLATADELWRQADDVDLVVVATPNDVHAALATAALDLGKAVVVDKPFALASSDAAAVAEHARSKGLALSVFHNRRWDSDTLTVRALLADGRLGAVHRLESRFTRFRPQVQQRWREQPGGGGVLLDLGTHLVDQAVHLLGPVAAVYAEVRARRTGALVDDDCLLVLTHDGGASSLLWGSAAAPWTGPRLVLQGSRAGWVKDGLDGQEDAQRRGVPPAPEPDGTLWDERGRHPWPSAPGDWPAYYRAFAAAVRGHGPVPVDPAEAVSVLRVLEAAVRSSDTGAVVPLG